MMEAWGELPEAVDPLSGDQQRLSLRTWHHQELARYPALCWLA